MRSVKKNVTLRDLVKNTALREGNDVVKKIKSGMLNERMNGECFTKQTE